jgi:hypothetical protein
MKVYIWSDDSALTYKRFGIELELGNFSLGKYKAKRKYVSLCFYFWDKCYVIGVENGYK